MVTCSLRIVSLLNLFMNALLIHWCHETRLYTPTLQHVFTLQLESNTAAFFVVLLLSPNKLQPSANTRVSSVARSSQQRPFIVLEGQNVIPGIG